MTTSTNLMIGTISLSSIHLLLSFIVLVAMIVKPSIVKVSYLRYLLMVSIAVNFIIFILCFNCKQKDQQSEIHNRLMNTCLGLSLIHMIVSFLMLNFIDNDEIVIGFLVASVVINSIIIQQSNECKNLEH
jgi:hypothetical protein